MPDPITPLATPSALWSRAKADYLDGVTADEACRRYGLSRSRFFERAKAEGWRRADRLPDVEDEDELALESDGPLASARSLADRAWRRAERAIAHGKLLEAQAWTRLTRDLRRLACEEQRAPDWGCLVRRDPAPQESALADFAGPPETGLTAPESDSENALKTEGWTEEPDFPDSAIESGRAPPPPLTEDPQGWPAWAALCEHMRREQPDEPCWGEGIEALGGGNAPSRPTRR